MIDSFEKLVDSILIVKPDDIIQPKSKKFKVEFNILYCFFFIKIFNF